MKEPQYFRPDERQANATSIIIKRGDKDWSPQDIEKSMEAKGKPKKLVAGSWIHDLCALKKVITLCPLCTHKFNPGRLGYIKEKVFTVVQAKCDGCDTFDPRCTAYFWEETYSQVRATPQDIRKARQDSLDSLRKFGRM